MTAGSRMIGKVELLIMPSLRVTAGKLCYEICSGRNYWMCLEYHIFR